MSDSFTETGVNQSRGMRKEHLLISVAVIALFSSGIFAQTEQTMKRVNEESRAKIAERMSAEAKKFKLELNGNSLTLNNAAI